MTDYILTGPVKRRAEVAGEIEALHGRRKVVLTAQEGLDSTILQFDPSYVVETIRPKAFRPPADWSHKGQ